MGFPAFRDGVPVRNVLFSLARLLVNQFLPLLLLPFIARRAGVSVLGDLLFAQAILWYAIVAVEYGFNLTGVAQISRWRDDLHQRARVYGQIQTTRLTIALGCAFLLALASWLRLIGPGLTLQLTLGFVSVLGAALQPIWYLQGLESFAIMSVAQIAARLLCLGSIFFVLQGPGDVFLAQFLMSMPFLLTAMILIPYVNRMHRSVMREGLSPWQTVRAVRGHFSEGFDLFLSQVATTSFTSTNILVIGLVLGPLEVGYFGLAEKVVRGIAQLTSPLTEAIYPRFVRSMAEGKGQALRFARRLLVHGVVCLVLVGLLLELAADWVGRLLAGSSGADTVAVALRIMAFMPAMVYANNICGTQVLLSLGGKRQFRNNVLLSGLSVPVSGAIAMYCFGFVGAPIGALVGEMLILYKMAVDSFELAGSNWIRGRS